MIYDYIFLYNNFEKPYLKIYFKNEDEDVMGITINFKVLNDGIFVDKDNIVEAIKNKFDTKGKKALLLLNCEEIYTNLSVYPSLNIRKSRRIYDTQFSNEFVRPTEYLIKSEFDSGNSSGYICHFVPRKILDFFKTFLEELEFDICHFDLFSSFISKKYNKLIDKRSYLLFYDDDIAVNATLVYEGDVVYSKCFTDGQFGYNRTIITFMDSFVNKFDRVFIDKIVSNKEIPSLKEDNYEVIEYALNFDDYEGRAF